MVNMKGAVSVVLVVGIALIALCPPVFADRFSGGSYIIDASVSNSLGGSGTSASYTMVASGGESVIGNGSGGSYLLASGYTAQLVDPYAMILGIAPTPLDFGQVTAGSPVNVDFSVTARAWSNNYALAIHQDHNLQAGANTIPAISGTIASKSSWTAGTTKGLGFTVLSATGTAPSASWNSGSAYAALPGTTTSFYTRTAATGAQDSVAMRLRLDVATNQAAGTYTNAMTITGTATP